MFQKCLKNEAPVYLKNKIQYLSDSNHYSLRNVVSENLQIPKAKTEPFKKTLTYSVPKLWNKLPFSIRQASSHNAFKTKVKSLILMMMYLKLPLNGSAFVQNASKPHKDCNCLNVTFFAEATVLI